MSSVTSVPITGLNSLGTIKTAGILARTIRQISVIHAPNLNGSDGDLVIDSGDTSRPDNGKLKVKGGLSGDTKTEVLETGVWDNALSIGILTNTTTTAQTISDHVAQGTLLTGLKIPILGGNTMDADKVYTLRNVGNSGHVAWGTVNDLGGNITINGGLSVSSDTFLAQNLSCGGNYTLDGAATVGSTLSVNGAVVLDSTVSIGASCDITNAIRIGGASLLDSTLSVNSTVFLGDALDVTGSFTAESDSVLKGTLSVGGSLTVGQTATVTSSVVVGTTLSVGGEVTIEGNLNVQGTTTTINSATLTVEDKTIELGVVASPTDATATGAGVIIKGASDKEILYTRSSETSNSTQQLSAFQISEDIVLDKKTKPFNDTLVSRLTTSERSQVVHLGDLASTDGHWMIVADISNGKLQFWYGQDIPDDSAMESVPASSAKLAFEIQKPA
jgi:predicted acyltransferase (DUF342 family)